MNVGCPQCASVFRVDPAKVPPGGVHARCSICGGVIPVPEPSDAERAAVPTPAVPRPAFETPAAARSARTPTPAAVMPSFTPTPAGAQAIATPSAPIQRAPTPVTPSPAMPSATPHSGAHMNPYLARDPHQRARRLARALASDIVTYYPDRHAEGLQSGSLKEQFSEEIKKSYEDYLAQVGGELAQSTTYFQDALNEVLARGEKVF